MLSLNHNLKNLSPLGRRKILMDRKFDLHYLSRAHGLGLDLAPSG
jgi:hypothetical protein